MANPLPNSARPPASPVAPEANLEIYSVLFAIETILRELIIDGMSKAWGPQWYRDHLPHEADEHFRSGIERDRATRWTSNLPHHPVYYLTFPDVRATIEAKGNWNGVFKDIFPKNKELVTTDLAELEFIRNKVAHNRRATTSDVAIVRAAYEKLCSEVGPTLAATLVNRYSVESDIPRHLAALRREADISFALVARSQPVRRLERWGLAQSTWWWFDDVYLGRSLNDVRMYFSSIGPFVAVKAVAADVLDDRRTEITKSHSKCRSNLSALMLELSQGQAASTKDAP